jgi:hypothetical protein
MSKKELPISNDIEQEQFLLKNQIQFLEKELDDVDQEIRAFEGVLRSHLMDLIIETQELFVLYKQIKEAKKAKRLEQKKRGKNYKPPRDLPIATQKKSTPVQVEQQKERKKLYREAMLHVHPDKFSMNEGETDIATEITTQLIEIYESGDLERLRAYHAHIFSGNALVQLKDIPTKTKQPLKDTYLQDEKERLEEALKNIKNSHIYTVLKEYENPLTFVDELKVYYEDRVFKLRKRTRKGL